MTILALFEKMVFPHADLNPSAAPGKSEKLGLLISCGATAQAPFFENESIPRDLPPLVTDHSGTITPGNWGSWGPERHAKDMQKTCKRHAKDVPKSGVHR